MHSAVVLKTVEIPQLQFLDRVVVPRSVQRQVLIQTVLKTVELPQVQPLWCCGRHCDHTARSSSPVVRFLARFSSTECRDIPVMPTVQFLNKVVDMVLYVSCPLVRTEQLRSSTRSSTSLVQNSGSASDSVIDRVPGCADFSSPRR